MVVRNERSIRRGAVTVGIGLVLGFALVHLFGCEKDKIEASRRSVEIHSKTPTQDFSLTVSGLDPAPVVHVQNTPSVLIVPAPFPINAECSK